MNIRGWMSPYRKGLRLPQRPTELFYQSAPVTAAAAILLLCSMKKPAADNIQQHICICKNLPTKQKKLQEPKKKSPKERPSATSEPPVVRTARPNTAHMALTCILNCVTAAREKVRFCLPPALRQMLCATATFRFRKHRLSKTIRIRKW